VNAEGAIMVDVVERFPKLEAISLEGRYAVLFSPFDISCALQGRGTPECAGYAHEDAAKLGLNLILYALQR
jgi:hypothetical protein